MCSVSTQHPTLFLFVLAMCLVCGANGHRRLTLSIAVTLLLLAVALQLALAPVFFLGAPPSARVHPPRRAALVMGHLVRVSVSDFSTPDPQIHSQRRLHYDVVAPMNTCKQLGETVPAMH